MSTDALGLDTAGIMYAGTQATDDDKRLLVRFSLESRVDRKATAEAGDGVIRYKNVEFVTIHIPGDKTLNVHRPVMPSDKQRFPLQYAAFKNSGVGNDGIIGTPLSIWPGCTPAQASELAYFNVRTVEQLAAMPDGVRASQMMGVNALRNAARAFVENNKQQAPLLKVQAELKERDQQIAALTETVKEQGEQVKALIARLTSDPAKEPAPKKAK